MGYLSKKEKHYKVFEYERLLNIYEVAERLNANKKKQYGDMYYDFLGVGM